MDRLFSRESRENREKSIAPDLLFLIAKYLDSGVCKRAAEVLFEEIREQKLVPDRIDWLGNKHERTFVEWERLHPHIGGVTLLRLCSNLLPLLDRMAPAGSLGANTLLGAGSYSVLRTQPDECLRSFSFSRTLARTRGQPLLDPLALKRLPPKPRALIGRELNRTCLQRHLVTESIFSRCQLLKRSVGHLSAVYCCVFDRTGFYIVTGADDRLVKVWSAINGRLMATLRGASAEISDLAISVDNSMVAAGSCDRIVRVWDLSTTAPIAVLSGHNGHITAISFCPGPSPLQQFIVSTSNDGCVAFWYFERQRSANDTATSSATGPVTFSQRPVKINERVRPGQAQLVCLSFSAGGTFLAVGGADHHVRVYVTTGDEGVERVLEVEAHTDRVDSVHWCHSGCRFVSGSKDGSIIIWRFERQEWMRLKIMMQRLPNFHGPRNDVRSARQQQQQRPLRVNMVRWTRDDTRIVTTVSDTSFRVFDSVTGELVHALAGHTDEVFVIESHPIHSSLVLSAGHDGKLIVWNIDSGTILMSHFNLIHDEGHGCLFDARWSPCGMFIAATDSHGQLLYFGLAPNAKYDEVPCEQFFHTDYWSLIRDEHHQVLDEQTQLAPHLMPAPFLVAVDGTPYPARFQRLVPGRERASGAQLQPDVPAQHGQSDSDSHTEEHAQPARIGEDSVRISTTIASSSSVPASVVHSSQQRSRGRRATIDDMIDRLAREQYGDRLDETDGNGESVSEITGGGAEGGRVSGEGEPSGQVLYSGVLVPTLTERRRLQILEFHQQECDKEMAYYHHQLQLSPWRSHAHSASVCDQQLRRLRRRQRLQLQLSTRRAAAEAAEGARGTRYTRRMNLRMADDEAIAESADAMSTTDRVPPAASSPSSNSASSSSSSTQSSDSQSSDEQVSSGDFAERVVPSTRLTQTAARPVRLTVRQRALQRQRLAADPSPSSSQDRTSPQPGPSSLMIDASDRRLRRRRLRRVVEGSSADEAGESAEISAATAEADREVAGSITATGGPRVPVSATSSSSVTTCTVRSPRKSQRPPTLSQSTMNDLFTPSAWITEVQPRRSPYFPQIGDELVYFKHGHQLYVQTVQRRGVYEVKKKLLPWSRIAIQEVEFVRVIDVQFDMLPPCVCSLRLVRTRAAPDGATGQFTVVFHDIADVVDFLVLRSVYEPAVARKWKPGQRFRSCIENTWWTGTVQRYSPVRPDCAFLCYHVTWSQGESEQLSPWDMEPISADTEEGSSVGQVTWPVTAADWLGRDPGSQRRRILSGLQQIMQLSAAESFLAPVDLNLYPIYARIIAYPIDLSTINSRLENGFYRRVTAMQRDLFQLAENTERFNEPHSSIVRCARIVRDVCLLLTTEVDCVNVRSLYQRVVRRLDAGRQSPVVDIVSADVENDVHHDSRMGERHRRHHSQQSVQCGGGVGGLQDNSPRVTRQIAKRRFSDKTWQEHCAEVLDSLVRHADSEPFRSPPDRNSHPDYYQMIEQPVDLSTISRCLRDGQYDGPQDFADHVRLIFSNSKQYNTSKRSMIYTMTLRLSGYFEVRIKPILSVFAGRQRPSRVRRPPNRSEYSFSPEDCDSVAATKRLRRSRRYSGVSSPDPDEPSSPQQPGPSGSAVPLRRCFRTTTPPAAVSVNNNNSNIIGGGNSRFHLRHRRQTRHTHHHHDDDDDDDDDESQSSSSSATPRREPVRARGASRVRSGLRSCRTRPHPAPTAQTSEENEEDDEEEYSDEDTVAATRTSQNGHHHHHNRTVNGCRRASPLDASSRAISSRPRRQVALKRLCVSVSSEEERLANDAVLRRSLEAEEEDEVDDQEDDEEEQDRSRRVVRQRPSLSPPLVSKRPRRVIRVDGRSGSCRELRQRKQRTALVMDDSDFSEEQPVPRRHKRRRRILSADAD